MGLTLTCKALRLGAISRRQIKFLIQSLPPVLPTRYKDSPHLASLCSKTSSNSTYVWITTVWMAAGSLSNSKTVIPGSRTPIPTTSIRPSHPTASRSWRAVIAGLYLPSSVALPFTRLRMGQRHLFSLQTSHTSSAARRMARSDLHQPIARTWFTPLPRWSKS